MKKILLFFVALLVILVVGLFIIWSKLFPEVYHFQNWTLHYQSINAEDTSELLIAQRRLNETPVYDSMESYSVYLCPTSVAFDALAPFNRGANSRLSETLNAILLRPLPKYDENEKP